MASLERPDAKPSIICTMIRVESLANNFMSESEKLPIRCFFSNLEGCNPASVTVIDGERISDVSIKDEKRGYCILSINEYTSVKGYTCKVPDDFWTLNSVEDDIMAGADVLRMILSTPEDDELKVYGISCKI